MNEKVKPMRILNPKMISGLINLCDDIRTYTSNKPLAMIEVGCYIGESTNIFLNNLNLERISCIDPWEANDKYHVDDISTAYKLFKAQFEKHPKVVICKGYSIEYVSYSQVVYIDASHKYSDVKEDIEHWKIHASIICGHDYEDKGKFGVKQAVDEIFGKPDKVYEDTSWIVFLNERKQKKNDNS